MSTTPRPNAGNRLAGLLIPIGTSAMLVGALNPMEGSLLILPGSGLVALGTLLDQRQRRGVAYRLWVLTLVAIGVGALWGLSAVGGFGGNSGRSIGWGVLIVPYLIGWWMGIWGPGAPRWSLLFGIVIGLWYLAIPAMILARAGLQQAGPAIVIGGIGLLTIIGCIGRLRGPTAHHSWAAGPPKM